MLNLIINVLLYTSVPIFGLMITGMVFRHFKWLGQDFGEQLLKFVFMVSIPALLFLKTAIMPYYMFLNPDTLRFLYVFGAGVLSVYVVVFITYRYVLKRPVNFSLISATSSAMPNTAFIGFPLLLALFNQGVVFSSILTIIFVVLVFVPIGTFILDFSQENQRSFGALVKYVLTTFYHLLRTPLIFAPILGIFVSFMQVPVPRWFSNYCNDFQMAVIPCSLFAIGFAIEWKHLRTSLGYCFCLNIAKLVIMPAVILCLAIWAHLPILLAVVATVIGGSPTAKTVMVLAMNAKTLEQQSLSNVTVSTIFSIASLTIWIIILNSIWPNYFYFHSSMMQS